MIDKHQMPQLPFLFVIQGLCARKLETRSYVMTSIFLVLKDIFHTLTVPNKIAFCSLQPGHGGGINGLKSKGFPYEMLSLNRKCLALPNCKGSVEGVLLLPLLKFKLRLNCVFLSKSSNVKQLKINFHLHF